LLAFQEFGELLDEVRFVAVIYVVDVPQARCGDLRPLSVAAKPAGAGRVRAAGEARKITCGMP
jgi:hypothetical protein